MMEYMEEKESKMISGQVFCKWKISDFSTETLPEEAMISPVFKYFGRDFQLELLRRGSDTLRLRLIQSDSDDPRRISKCTLGFYKSNSVSSFGENIKLVRHTNIFYDMPIDDLKKACLTGNILAVYCIITVTQLKHICSAQPVTETSGILAKKGHAALAENIGTILEDSRFSDVALKVGEETFQAHKAILASRSKVFDGMFKSNLKESQESVVEIAEMKPDIFKEMLQYIYTGTIGDLCVNAAINLYVGSDRYDLQELKGWCKEFILEHISSDDVCRVAVIADLHSDDELAKASRRVFKEKSRTILLSEEWRDFGKKNPSLQTELLESALLSDN